MKAQRMPGLLCRSDISTSVCVPGDPRSVVMVPRRPEHWAAVEQARLIDLKYSRHPHARRAPSRDPRRSTMSLPPTVTKRGRNPPKAALVPPLPPSSDHVFQVVVMRVSLHCQGCAGKLRKHISKMEGVTSFSIDLESKRVTVMGHVSPVGVLESVSKVKKAEFWPC